jgi:hypothetical protein
VGILQSRQFRKKWYANPVNAGKFTVKDFAKEIAGRSLLTRGDIENTLDNFPEELPTVFSRKCQWLEAIV